MGENEYIDIMDETYERVGCSNRIKNIHITKEYSNIEFVQFLYLELGIKREIPFDKEENMNALYDILGDIPSSLNNKVIAINLFIENKKYLKMIW